MVKTLLSSILLFSLTAAFSNKNVERSFLPEEKDTSSNFHYITPYVTKFYPNPATSYITFEFDKKVENNSRLIIYSFTGKKMTEVIIANLKITVTLSEYYRGLYVFQLISPKGVIEESGKFQVMK